MDYWDNSKKRYDKAYEDLCRERDLAKSLHVLVGRFFTEPVADGMVIYKVVKENKKTVRIRLQNGEDNVLNPDMYCVPYWGQEATVDKEYVVSKISMREHLDEMFSRRAS